MRLSNPVRTPLPPLQFLLLPHLTGQGISLSPCQAVNTKQTGLFPVPPLFTASNLSHLSTAFGQPITQNRFQARCRRVTLATSQGFPFVCFFLFFSTALSFLSLSVSLSLSSHLHLRMISCNPQSRCFKKMLGDPNVCCTKVTTG